MRNEGKSSVLIDTDVAIDFLRGVPEAKSFFELLWQRENPSFSIISVYELYAGMRKKEETATASFIDACIIQYIDLEIAKTAGGFYRKYRGKGITLSSSDCLIMATALCRKLKIATRNIKHYPEEDLLLWRKKEDFYKI